MSMTEVVVALAMLIVMAFPLFTCQSTERLLICRLEEEVLMGALLEDAMSLYAESPHSLRAWRALRQCAGGDGGRLTFQLLHPMMTNHACLTAFSMRRRAVRQRLKPSIGAKIVSQRELSKVIVELTWTSRNGSKSRLLAERLVVGDLSSPNSASS